MCGIIGFVGFEIEIDNEIFKKSLSFLSHRGPDAAGVYSNSNFLLGHTRLSIIDLENGKQPMVSKSGKSVIVFNGEIYNYLDLKTKLSALDYVFTTNSDTEVVLNGYEEWGIGIVNKMRGMFSFAIYDKTKEELFLARDHFGIKPLVYFAERDRFIFSSEIQSINKLKDLGLTIDTSALNDYLQFQYIPAPRTIYHQIKKLPAAHFMRVGSDGKIKECCKYWSFSYQPDSTKTESQWLSDLDEVLFESVKAHTIADVPFGAFLSGGIDSSLVVGYMSKILKAPVETFTIGFQNPDFDELSYARTVSDKYTTGWNAAVLGGDILTILPDLVRHYGEPFGDSSAIPTFFVSKLAHQKVKMVLSGDGGDEFFAGYQSYTGGWCKHISSIPEHLQSPKRLAYRILNHFYEERFPLRTNDYSDWIKYINYFNESERSNLLNSQSYSENHHNDLEDFFHKAHTTGHFQKAQLFDIHSYLPGDILNKVDIASMMNSIEVRTPLLDTKVMDLVSRIPEQFHINKKSGKWEGKLLLKKLLEKDFSNDFIYRRKKGFSIPLQEWLETSNVISRTREMVYSTPSFWTSYFNLKKVEQVLAGNNYQQIWLLVVMAEWINQHDH